VKLDEVLTLALVQTEALCKTGRRFGAHVAQAFDHQDQVVRRPQPGAAGERSVREPVLGPLLVLEQVAHQRAVVEVLEDVY